MSRPQQIAAGEEKYFALADLSYFLRRYFNLQLPPFQREWCRICQSEGNKIVFAPAAHGKTSIFSIGYPIWELAKNRRLRMIIASNVDDLAKDILSVIRYHMENNALLKQDFGPFYSPECEWTDYTIRVLDANYKKPVAAWKPVGQFKDPSIRAVGVGTASLGRRCDRLICDDILTLKNSRSEEQRQAVRWWYFNELEPTLDDSGRAIWVGNPQHRDDLSGELAKDSTYSLARYQAIVSDSERKVLWPEKWTYEKLTKRRNRDPASFARRYQSIPVSDSDFVDYEKLRFIFDDSQKLKDALTDEDLSKYTRVILAVDPAFTVRRRSSFSVILTIGLRKQDRKLEIIGAFKGKVLYETLKKVIAMKGAAFKVHEIAIESNAQQQALVSDVSRDATVHVPVVPSFTGSKDDPETGLSLILRLIEQRMIVVPYGDDVSRAFADDMANEIAEYPEGEHDDIYMALYLGCRRLVSLDAERRVIPKLDWTSRSPYRILGRTKRFRYLGAVHSLKRGLQPT